MNSLIVSPEQTSQLLEDCQIIATDQTQASTTYYLLFQGREAVLVNTAVENYLITQGRKK